MVLDHDWRNGADTDDLHPTWNKTLAVATPNGLHAYYQCPDPQKTCAELDGIGLKADGGYVLVPPSTRSDSKYDYEWFKTLAPLQLPIGYLDRFTPATVYRRLPAELQHRVDRQRTTAIIRVRERYAREWADAGLRKQKEYLDKSRVGRRNWQLNISAFALAQIVAIGRLAELTVISVLTEAALSVGLTPAETRATIASGMSRGRLFPRRVIFV
jgi:hypothetical protein